MADAIRKKRVLLHSDFPLASTGFGRVQKALSAYLWKTGKYEVKNLCCGIPEDAPQLDNVPWSCEGVIENTPQMQQQMQADPNFARMVTYGGVKLDKVVSRWKPDVYIGFQDVWGIDYAVDKSWFKNITSCVWLTLDSIPVLKSAIDIAPKVKNYLVWASFAERELKKLGFNHVKTLPGCIETENFYRLDDSKKKELRKKFGIDEDTFVIFSGYRNQLRKLVPNMLQGVVEFKKRNPQVKVKYINHTHLSEGWPVMSLAEQYGLDTKDILVTYICRNCGEYEVKCPDDRTSPHEVDEQGGPKIDSNGKFIEKSIQLQDKDCKYCGAQKAQITCNVSLGVQQSELNEIINLADVNLGCFTSGGLEIVHYECKLAEVLTIVTNYSCGEDLCESDAYSLPLEHATYWEHGTNFEKASPYPSSVAKQLEKAYKMTKADKRKWGAKAREWALSKVSTDNAGKFFENLIDEAPLLDDTDEKLYQAGEDKKWNPNAQLNQSYSSDEDFLVDLYHKVLDASDVDNGHKDVLYWKDQIKNGMAKEQVVNTFRNIASQELQKTQTTTIEDLLDKNGRKRFLVICKDSAGDILMVSAILESLKSTHLDFDIYFACEPIYFSLLEGCPSIHKLIPYQPIMDSEIACTGNSKNKGMFDKYCFVPVASQRFLNYLTLDQPSLQLQ